MWPGEAIEADVALTKESRGVIGGSTAAVGVAGGGGARVVFFTGVPKPPLRGRAGGASKSSLDDDLGCTELVASP
jgi:hypothetical protein